MNAAGRAEIDLLIRDAEAEEFRAPDLIRRLRVALVETVRQLDGIREENRDLQREVEELQDEVMDAGGCDYCDDMEQRVADLEAELEKLKGVPNEVPEVRAGDGVVGV